jgi:hypothetical protein
VLLFLNRREPTPAVAGFSQGKYMIERDRSGQAFVRQAFPADNKAGGPAATQGATSATTERVALEQFLNRVLPQR